MQTAKEPQAGLCLIHPWSDAKVGQKVMGGRGRTRSYYASLPEGKPWCAGSSACAVLGTCNYTRCKEGVWMQRRRDSGFW